jgi:hypothetical protein
VVSRSEVGTFDAIAEMKQTFSRIDITVTTGIGKSKTEATFITHDPDGSFTLYAIYKNEIP